MNFLMEVVPTFQQRFNSWVLQRSLHLLNFHSFKNILGYIFQHAAWHNTEFKWNTVFKMNEQCAYCHYPDPFYFLAKSIYMTGTDNGHDSGGWKQHNFFALSGVGAMRLWAHLGVPPQPSAVLWKSAGTSSTQGWGMEAGGLTRLF